MLLEKGLVMKKGCRGVYNYSLYLICYAFIWQLFFGRTVLENRVFAEMSLGN